jgi:serine phosphatase RsbU (regulator of sigma subunit)/CHASE2 domain-containing sensor protein
MTDWKSRFRDLVGPGGTRGALLVAVLWVLAMAADLAPQQWLRNQLFDGYQRALPRERSSQPAMVVEIDERSLAAYGQWPWPRSRLGELVERIAETQPAAIGLDMFFPEPDRLSPRRVIASVPNLEPAMAKHAAKLPDNDALFAASMRGKPVVLGVVGEDAAAAADADRRPVKTAPVLLKGEAAGILKIPQFSGVVRSLPELEAAAAGQGLLNGPSEGVVRRVPIIGRLGDQVLPNLEVEMLRLASGAPVVSAILDADGVRALQVADRLIATDPDGAVWLRYGRVDPMRHVSAMDVLDGKLDPEKLRSKFVLVGITGLGLVDQPPIPLGYRVPGVEIRVQLLENIFDRSWLRRPAGALAIEAILFAALAFLFVRLVPRGNPLEAFLILAGGATVVAVAGLVAFNLGLLVDVATPGAGAILVFTVVLAATLTESQRQRHELSRRLQAERELAARLAGELETARRVQMGMLPESPGELAGDRRIQLKAFMEPARSVGGDLYDFFMVDERTLCVMIGDVSGKGLAAAMFMALIRSLCKSSMLRLPRALDQALVETEAQIKRENPESLFVTLFVMALDLETGEFTFCNAGHDPLYGLNPSRADVRKLDHGGRPPLCVLDGYPYPLGRERLVPGDTLCMITDGITEAANPAGQLYGHERLERVLTRLNGASPEELVDGVRQDVGVFVAGAEPADDMSVLALRWMGPAGGPVVSEP